eukprot:COSAG05_NODE_22023_length_267_cov_1.238095_1_plen_25_part_01
MSGRTEGGQAGRAPLLLPGDAALSL